MTYFTGCNTPDEVRARYRKLAKENHPDLGGDTRTMQLINAAYEAALKAMSGKDFRRTTPAPDGRETWHYTYDEQTEQEIMEAIAQVLKAVGDRPDITITLVGLWLWIVGNTRPIKDDLKAIGCYWNRKREAWNWKPAGSRSFYNERVTLDDILAEGVRIQRQQETAAGRLAA